MDGAHADDEASADPVQLMRFGDAVATNEPRVSASISSESSMGSECNEAEGKVGLKSI